LEELGPKLLISAILLAAGESRRMGELKQLLPFKEKTVIEQSIDNLLNSQVNNIVVVLGHEWERILEKIQHLPVTITVNENYRQGMLSSLQRGLQALSESNRAILVMLGDQPHVPPSVIDQLIEVYRQETHGIIIPKYEGKRGHPILLDGKYREEILKIDPTHSLGLNQVVRSHPEDILEIPVSTPAIIQDMDTPEDYTRIKDMK
jgi:molybdenum cofactor cytidylyltransferase